MSNLLCKLFELRYKGIISPQATYPNAFRKIDFFENGMWKYITKCPPEYDIGTDSCIGGCGNTVIVSECDLRVDCEIYLWQCKNCGEWHSIHSGFIPEIAKYRIRERSKLQSK